METGAKILCDSVSPAGHRLTTFECVFPRIILAEVNTHRALCLAGDSDLEFDLPGSHARGQRVVTHMRLDEFVDKWLGGGRRIGANPKRQADLSWIEDASYYAAHNVAAYLGMHSASNIHRLCREGTIPAQKDPHDGRTWLIKGSDIRRWRESSPEHTRYDMRARLGAMRIRQLNEDTGDIQWSHVVDVSRSGVKQVFEVRAGEFKVTGSADHRVFTVAGWKTIQELKNGDYLVVRKFGKKNEDKLDPLRLKKIDGRWRSVWQRKERERLITEDPKCRKCRWRDGEDVHHVTPVHQAPELAFDPNNITLLCEPCHDSEHELQGWQGGTYLYGAMVRIDSVDFRGEEETFDLSIAGRHANFLANGVVVHNSRNSASSRAIPVEKMIARVLEDPYVPTHWGKNQRGMQAEQDVGEQTQQECRWAWEDARDYAVEHARKLAGNGIHKQITNRLLEPFMWHTALITGTEWSNFFNLRDNKDAHPDFRDLAHAMRELYEDGGPMQCDHENWHMPLVAGDEVITGEVASYEDLIKVSVGRCARVSYLTHDGKRDPQADVDLCERLLASGHMSPFEHVARPMTVEELDLFKQKKMQWVDRFKHWAWVGAEYYTHSGQYDRVAKEGEYTHFLGNLNGWIAYRKLISHEDDILGARS